MRARLNRLLLDNCASPAQARHMNRRAPRLQETNLFVGRGRAHFAHAHSPPLSLKTTINCRTRYRVDRSDFLVDEHGYLILNERQPYDIAIDARRNAEPAETFIVWFPSGWAEDVAHAQASADEALIADPRATAAPTVNFFERYTPHDELVSPGVRVLRAAHRRAAIENFWLEEKLRELLARMLHAQQAQRCVSRRLNVVRAATRDELWRRLNRARDLIHARSNESLTLEAIAQACGLSPFHLLRSFRALFGVTPHAWLSTCRIEHAKFLLRRTTETVTEICAQTGFESLGSFSTWFRRATGVGPREWRRLHGCRASIRKIREVSPSGDLLFWPQ